MTFPTIKYKAFSLLAALGALCAGCHSDAPCAPGGEEPDVPVPDPDKVTLCLNISFEGQDSQTRAEDNEPDGYEDPSGDFEKISTLRVVIVRNYKEEPTGNGGVFQTGIVEANKLVKTTDAGKPLYDNLEFKVIANEYKRIYLIANEQSLTAPQNYDTASKYLDSFEVVDEENEKYGPIDLSSLSNWTESVPDLTSTMTQIVGYGNGLFSPAPSRRLPLTEIFDVMVNSETAIDDICFSNLFITRAAAKATFLLDPEGLDLYKEKDINITSISLFGVGSEEYVFPNKTEYSLGKYQGDGIPNSNIGDTYITTFATPTASKPLTYLLDFITEANPDGMSMDIASTEPVDIAGPIYFPESILAKDQYYQVTVTLSNEVELKAPLKTEGDNIANILNIDGHEAIARNTHLQITLKIEDQELTAEVTIVPYIGIDLTPGFGFEQLLPGDHHQPTDW